MNEHTFLSHWKIRRNPFADEEARHDEVFRRLLDRSFEHFEVPKILGDLRHPSSAVVFGAKGSGKTAIRMQIEATIDRHNREHPGARVLVIAHDDLNPMLDRLVRRSGGADVPTVLRTLRLNDHVDGMLSVAVPDLVDRALAARRRSRSKPPSGGEGEVDRAVLGRLPRSVRADWMLLQALYDRPDQLRERGRALRRRLGVRRGSGIGFWRGLAVLLWGLAAAGGLFLAFFPVPGPRWAAAGGFAALLVLALAATVVAARRWLHLRGLARRISKQLRVLDRGPGAVQSGLERLPMEVLHTPLLPVDEMDEARYEMLARLRRAIRPFGFRSVVVLMDRVDEPTLVNGDRRLMQAVVWPLLNNKFLQQPGLAIKMMLPIELRYAIQAESAAFFQSARLDKQNMIERLQWSGATLYDLCNRRIRACLENGGGDGGAATSLRDLFDEETSREDLLAALDQMRQPRDAFKLIHQLVQQHCANVTDEEEAWRIPRHVIDEVLGRQKERLDALRSGLAPA